MSDGSPSEVRCWEVVGVHPDMIDPPAVEPAGTTLRLGEPATVNRGTRRVTNDVNISMSALRALTLSQCTAV